MGDWDLDDLADCLPDMRSQIPMDRSQTIDHMDFVSSYIDSLDKVLRPINLKIHDNPELNYKEFIAHDTLQAFMKTRRGWKVTPSAYGIETAFIAEFDSGKEGPVVSFNAEYGMSYSLEMFSSYMN